MFNSDSGSELDSSARLCYERGLSTCRQLGRSGLRGEAVLRRARLDADGSGRREGRCRRQETLARAAPDAGCSGVCLPRHDTAVTKAGAVRVVRAAGHDRARDGRSSSVDPERPRAIAFDFPESNLRSGEIPGQSGVPCVFRISL